MRNRNKVIASGVFHLLPFVIAVGATCSSARADLDASLISAWPQNGLDAAGTRRSSFAGPTFQPELKWFFPTEAPTIPHPNGTLVYANPTLGSDGTVYATSYNGNIYAVNPGGTEKWAHQVGQSLRSSASVAADGSIYQLSGQGLLHLDSDGQVLSNDADLQRNESSVTIDDDGKLHVVDGSTLRHLDSNGSEIWSVDVGGGIDATPVIGNGNTVYVGSRGPNVLNAIDNQGGLLWTFPISGGNVKAATIGDDGTIYAGGQSGGFFAINPNGTEKWRFDEADAIYTAAALTHNGGIVFAAKNAIFALDANGSEVWRYEEQSSGHGSVFVDINGNTFATRNTKVIALDSDGDLIWEFESASSSYVYSSVIMDDEGVLYFGAGDGLYAIAAPIPEPSSASILILSIVCLFLSRAQCTRLPLSN